MSFARGTINSATPATALMTALQAVIDAHTNWEFVEQVVGTNNTADVFKCLAAGNGLGQDFYVALVRANAGTGHVVAVLGEGYDSGTKKLVKPAVYNAYNGNTVASAADGSFATDLHVANDTQTVLGSNSTPAKLYGPRISLSASTNVLYFISVTNHRLIITTNNASGSSAGAYVGVYESLHGSADDPMPLFVGDLLTSNLQFQDIPGTAFHWGGAYTREHLVSATPTAAFQGGVEGPFNVVTRKTEVGTGTTKERLTNKFLPARMYVVTQSEGGIKGLLKDVYLFSLGTVTEAIDDTMIIDGVTYRMISMVGISWYVGYTTSVSVGYVMYPWVSEAA